MYGSLLMHTQHLHPASSQAHPICFVAVRGVKKVGGCGWLVWYNRRSDAGERPNISSNWLHARGDTHGPAAIAP